MDERNDHYLFHTELVNLIDQRHELAKLVNETLTSRSLAGISERMILLPSLMKLDVAGTRWRSNRGRVAPERPVHEAHGLLTVDASAGPASPTLQKAARQL